MHITQSGVSAQVRQLERELGVDLFDRSSRMVRLTRAGMAALPHARAALAAVHAIRATCDEVNGLVRGRLWVGMVMGCTVTPLFDALAALHRRHPLVEITLVEHNSDVLLDQVRSGDLDLALAATAGTIPSGLQSLTVLSEGLVAAAPPDHELAGAGSVSLAALGAYPLICLPPGTGVRGVLDEALAAQGVQASITWQATAPGAVLDLAARGLGVAVVSTSMVLDHPGLRAVPVAGISSPAVLSLVSRAAGRSPGVLALLDACRVAFALED